jgi:hypothetical protein
MRGQEITTDQEITMDQEITTGDQETITVREEEVDSNSKGHL